MKKIDRAIDYKKLNIFSHAFISGEMIPVKYTCDGANINPPLEIRNIPVEARSLAIIVDDPDAPSGDWVHWLVWNIPVRQHVKENCVPGIEGVNDFKQHYYSGPCPPSGSHCYYFKIYALDAMLDIPHTSNKIHLEKCMSDHILAFGEITGMYKRKSSAVSELSGVSRTGKTIEDFFISVIF